MSVKNTPSSKWITAEQYVILSKLNKKWADKLVKGDMNYIASYGYCIVGSVHDDSGHYAGCTTCHNYSEILNHNYNEACIFDSGTDSYFHALHNFRTALGNFIKHFKSEHEADAVRIKKMEHEGLL